MREQDTLLFYTALVFNNIIKTMQNKNWLSFKKLSDTGFNPLLLHNTSWILNFPQWTTKIYHWRLSQIFNTKDLMNILSSSLKWLCMITIIWQNISFHLNFYNIGRLPLIQKFPKPVKSVHFHTFNNTKPIDPKEFLP